jgi:hypothetical protein
MNITDAKQYSVDDINKLAYVGLVSHAVMSEYAALKSKHSIVGEYAVRDRLTANNMLAPEVFLARLYS